MRKELKTRFVRKGCIITAGVLLIIVCVLSASLIPLYATNIEEEKNKANNMRNDLKNYDAMIAELEKVKADTVAYITQLDAKLEEIMESLEQLNQQTEDKKKEISKKKKQIKKQQKKIDEQYEAMKKRIQYIYENGTESYIELLLKADSIADFLNRAEYSNMIAEYDRNMLLQLRESKDALQTSKKQLDQQHVELQELVTETEAQQASVEALVAQKQKEVKIVEEQITNTEKERKALNREIKAQEALINELEIIEQRRREEEERRRQEALKKKTEYNQLKYDGGTFAWPVEGGGRETSQFGYRTDPISGQYNAYHNGLDIAAPTGTPILAAYDGEVAWAYYSATAGNWIGIDHGGGLYTIYMHCSKLLVKEGDMVKKGQQIGLMGSTGRSTGPHLHFGIRMNGEYINPKLYIG